MARKAQAETERKTPERMGGMGDARLGEELASRLFKLIGPIRTRLKFAGIRSSLFQAMVQAQTIANEAPAESEE